MQQINSASSALFTGFLEKQKLYRINSTPGHLSNILKRDNLKIQITE